MLYDNQQIVPSSLQVAKQRYSEVFIPSFAGAGLDNDNLSQAIVLKCSVAIRNRTRFCDERLLGSRFTTFVANSWGSVVLSSELNQN